MILEFGFKNFFSFKEETIISLRLDANCPADISNGKDFSTVMGFKGANGSGKTQALKALSFLSNFCSDSFSTKPDEKIGLSPFFTSADPCEFYIEFRRSGLEYRYELIANDETIFQETLYKTGKRKTKILERKGNEISFRTESLRNLDAMKLRKNASIISTAHQYGLDELNDIHDFFTFSDSNVSRFGFHAELMNVDEIAQFLAKMKSKSLMKFINEFIYECDTGVTEIKLSSYKDTKGKEHFFPVFYHEVDGVKHGVLEADESSGTKVLFKTLAGYYLTLGVGGILIVDEIDMNLHPHIIPKIVDLFINPEFNKKNAQLIFATHDSDMLDLLGRYRTYFIAKEDNESFAYRLDEIPGDILRNDRPIRPVYNSGRIGGVPRKDLSRPTKKNINS